MFGITTHKKVPEELLTDYAAWDSYMAKIWSCLLTCLNLQPFMRVIEIAPGTSSKIGEALQRCHFQGEFYLIEPDKAALSTACNQLKRLIPKAKIIDINRTLTDSLPLLPKAVDFVLSNHPLDDMILSHPSHYKEENSLFDWTLQPSPSLSPSFIKQWLKINSDPDCLDLVKEDLRKQWNFFLDKLQPEVTIISQYSSAALKNNKLQALNMHASDVLRSLKKDCSSDKKGKLYHQVQTILNQFENYNDEYIGNEVLNAENWLVLVRK